MSGFNRFLSGATSADLSDGTAIINAASLTSITLNPDLPCATDAVGIIQTRLLDITDTQLVAGNPAITNHEMADFNITNVKETLYKSSNNVNTANIVYTGTSNVTVDLDTLTGTGITWVGGASTIDNLLSISNNTDPPVAKDSSIISSDLVLAGGASTTGHLASYSSGTGRVIVDSNIVAADVVTTSNWTVQNQLVRTGTVGTNLITGSGWLLDGSNDISIGADKYIAKANSSSQSVGLGAGNAWGATDINNTAVGRDALLTAQSDDCTAIGHNALSALCLNSNTAVGNNALQNCVSTGNTAIGAGAADSLTSGTGVFIGSGAGSGQSTASNCIAIGASSLLAANGGSNIAIGGFTGSSITSGSSNILIGQSAGSNLSSGSSNNICIASSGVSADSATTRIGGPIQTRVFIGGVDNASVDDEVGTVVCNSSDQLVVNQNHCPPGYINGMKLKYNSGSVVDVLAGDCRDTTNAANIHLTGTTTVNIASTGAGGLMTGQSDTSNTTYEVWGMHDDSGSNSDNAFLVPEGVTPLQTGYSHFRYLGAVANYPSNFINFYMTGLGSLRTVMYYAAFTTVRVLSGGSATTWANVVSSDSVEDLCPVNSGAVYLNVDFEADVATNADVRFRPDGDTNDHPQIYAVQSGGLDTTSSQAYYQIKIPLDLDGTRGLEYECSTASLDIDVAVQGYDLEL